LNKNVRGLRLNYQGKKKELNQLRDIQWENRQLATTCRELTMQLEAIQKLQEEDAKNYRSATAKVEALRATLHEMKAAEHHSKSPKINEKGEKFLSLAEELFDSVPDEKSGEIQKELENSKKRLKVQNLSLKKLKEREKEKRLFLTKITLVVKRI